jgi:hypothetical protein
MTARFETLHRSVALLGAALFTVALFAAATPLVPVA